MAIIIGFITFALFTMHIPIFHFVSLPFGSVLWYVKFCMFIRWPCMPLFLRTPTLDLIRQIRRLQDSLSRVFALGSCALLLLLCTLVLCRMTENDPFLVASASTRSAKHLASQLGLGVHGARRDNGWLAALWLVLPRCTQLQADLAPDSDEGGRDSDPDGDRGDEHF